jgi:putative addiction module component (TIGR02574 family)
VRKADYTQERYCCDPLFETESEMALAIERLKAELAELTERERADLAPFLLESLDEAGADTDTDVEAAWDAELARRADEIQRGAAEGKPAKQVFSELREKYS